MATLAGRARSAADLRLRPLHRLQGRPWSQGPVMLQQLALLKGFNLDGLDVVGAGLHPSAWSNARSSPTPTARHSMAIRTSSRCRSTTLLSDAYNAERRKLVDEQASLELRPGSVEGFGAHREARNAGREARRRHGRRRADRRPHGRGHRRHRAFRHRRPGRQHGLGDAVRRLAAILAGDPGTRLLPRHARPDVLARGRPSGLARARQAAAHHAFADAGAARRRRPISPGARPAATSRTSGSRSSSCATSMPA